MIMVEVFSHYVLCSTLSDLSHRPVTVSRQLLIATQNCKRIFHKLLYKQTRRTRRRSRWEEEEEQQQ